MTADLVQNVIPRIREFIEFGGSVEDIEALKEEISAINVLLHYIQADLIEISSMMRSAHTMEIKIKEAV